MPVVLRFLIVRLTSRIIKQTSPTAFIPKTVAPSAHYLLKTFSRSKDVGSLGSEEPADPECFSSNVDVI